MVLGAVFFLVNKIFFAPWKSDLLAGAVFALTTLILCYQSITMIGAWYAKDYVDDFANVGTSTIKNLESDTRIKELSNSLGIESEVQSGLNSGAATIDAIITPVREAINSYIWKRVIWILVFMLAGSVALYFLSAGSTSSRSSRHSRTAPASRLNNRAMRTAHRRRPTRRIS